jgi:glyoxylase-like metal-dependent hydrolase (beta-lactamase superfamily II)
MSRPFRPTRRALLGASGRLAAAAIAVRYLPADAWGRQAAAPPPAPNTLDARRAALAQVPIARKRLTDRLTMLSGPGGNVVVLQGPDGLHVVDTFVRPAWGSLKAALDAIGGPVTVAIDTHWHFDHADNNASLRKAGAAIVAHENTKRRLSQSHDVLGMHIPAEPPEALPTVTFADAHTIRANGEEVRLQYVPPAHTDSDISILFAKANVLHLGDLFFNGTYPFIDASTGGNVNGMVAAADRALALADATTTIVPGHGPLTDRAGLERYRTMLAGVRERVGALKTAGTPLPEVQAARPTASYDAEWGQGFMKPDDFVALVYATL